MEIGRMAPMWLQDIRRSIGNAPIGTIYTMMYAPVLKSKRIEQSKDRIQVGLMENADFPCFHHTKSANGFKSHQSLDLMLDK